MPDAIPPEGLVVCMLGNLMKERQLSTVQVCRIANISRPTVRKLRENRFDLVSMTTISKLCSSLNVGIGVLFRHYTLHEWKLQKIEHGQAPMGADDS